jgi:hypothetical protein
MFRVDCRPYETHRVYPPSNSPLRGTGSEARGLRVARALHNVATSAITFRRACIRNSWRCPVLKSGICPDAIACNRGLQGRRGTGRRTVGRVCRFETGTQARRSSARARYELTSHGARTSHGKSSERGSWRLPRAHGLFGVTRISLRHDRYGLVESRDEVPETSNGGPWASDAIDNVQRRSSYSCVG